MKSAADDSEGLTRSGFEFEHLDFDRGHLLAACLVVTAGIAVYWVAIDVFPYLSTNDDEGVYLLQAAMLLDGQLFLYPGAFGEAVRPWFFVVEDAGGPLRMYPKYTPVPAAFFALGVLVGQPNVVLGLVAAGIAAFVYTLSAMAFDRRTGTLAVVVLIGSPLFLLTSATFLPYAPTTLLNLAFAVGYVRSVRRDSRIWALAAGGAIGVAFFARPYTAVLFAAPFAIHACWTFAVAVRNRERLGVIGPRYLAIALAGLAGVCVTLAYNAIVTGAPLVFPYEAFAPRDGIGFGRREILGYERNYTPALAAATTVRLLGRFATEWSTLGTGGMALVGVGVVAFLRAPVRATMGALRSAGRSRSRPRLDIRTRLPAPADATDGGMPDTEVAALLLGLVPSVVLGNAYFWGVMNGLNNGLIALLGPFYHFDLLLVLSAFGAYGTLVLARGFDRRLRRRLSRQRARVVLVVTVLVLAPAAAGWGVVVVTDQLEDNRLRSETLAATYAPFERTDLDRALVFTPDPYGDWQVHPFQHLRNDPGFDGDVVYVTEGPPERDLRVLAATDRTPYRFTYRGTWTAGTTPVTPELERLGELRGDRIDARTTVGVPANASTASVRLETESGDTYSRYAVESVADRERLPVEWTIAPDGARVRGLSLAAGAEAIPVPAAGEVDLVVTFVDRTGATVTYRQELTLATVDGGLRAVWPPETRVCLLTTECGREGTWVGDDGEYLTGVDVETDARAVNATG